jgi:transposase
MAQKPIAMEQLKQILQLKNDGISIREIARRVHISRNSVRKYLSRCHTGTDNLSDKQLADEAYNNEQLQTNTERKLQLLEHFRYAESELSKTGVTRLLLWNEHLLKNPGGYGYSQYCDQFKSYLKHKDVSMHLEYNAADIMMVDFAGKK